MQKKTNNKLHFKKGDKVIVLSGRDKGKTGTIERVSVKTASVFVEGVNMVKKHVKVSQKYPTGGVVEVIKPIAVGKLMLICPSCGKATRIGTTITAKEKQRTCKKCGKAITAGITEKAAKPEVEKKVTKKESNKGSKK